MSSPSSTLVASIRHYVDRIVLADGKCEGVNTMKALLLDASTTQIVSAVYSQTEILNQQVYLVSRIDEINDASAAANSNHHHHAGPNAAATGLSSGGSSSSGHMVAVCFLRPTPGSIDALKRELSRPTPRFAEYHIFFSGIVSGGILRAIAEADSMHERVRQVQEFYADYVPVNEDLGTLQCRHTLAMSVAAGTSWAPKYATQYERNLQGLQSLLLSIRRQPSCIRYAGHSPCAEELAKDLHDSIQADEIFHFRRRGTTASSSNSRGGSGGGGLHVLVLDRRDDPVTPLLSQWTYQAMVHELLGLNNHRVILRGAPNLSKDLEEVVLSSHQDEFFHQNRHKNFGELGEAVQKLLKDYQKQTAQHSVAHLNTIEDMRNFMDRYPELRSKSHHVSKHVAIMGELARLVEACSLMDVSQFEQQLACFDDHNAHWRELMEKLSSAQIKVPDKLRLGLLYALRYEVSGNLHMVQSAMAKGGVPPDMVNLVNVILRYGGIKSRGPGLYGDNNHLMTKITKSFITTVQGVENVYSQHVPLLMDTIQSVIKGKLSTKTHPVVSGSMIGSGGGGPPGSSSLSASVSMSSNSSNSSRPGPVSPTDTAAALLPPDEVLVFMVGGITYEEGTKVHEFNDSMRGRGIRVLLAGSTIHNSTSFLDELKSTAL